MILYCKNNNICSIYQRRINTVIWFYIVFGIGCRLYVWLNKGREIAEAIVSRAINVKLLNHLLAKAKR